MLLEVKQMNDQLGFRSNDEHLSAAKDAVVSLLDYCRANDWAGYDPYDALNSEIFRIVPFYNLRLPRLAFTQVMKRCPFNLRRILLVPKTQNPKGLALFLTAFLKLSKLGLLYNQELTGNVADKLEALRSPNTPYWCWGYSFPWQGRNHLLVPAGAPNLVCTTFVAEAMLDLYEERGDTRHLNIAVSAADYLLNELYWVEGDTVASFKYPTPSSRTKVHNANFLGAALLCRVYEYTGVAKYLEHAVKVARYSAGRQQVDGAWNYGELPTQRWIDNFHTGYNLCGLRRIAHCAQTAEFDGHLMRGFQFYRKHFFREDGAPRYFHDRTYPLDVHSAAQSIITLLTFQDLDATSVSLAHSVFDWAMASLWDRQGYFYYQKQRWGTIKIPYMRWGQAWMLLALASLLENDYATSRAQAPPALASYGRP